LARLKARVALVDDVNTATPSDNNTVFVPRFRRLQGIPDFHNVTLNIYPMHPSMAADNTARLLFCQRADGVR
jgi:hypothetical protein